MAGDASVHAVHSVGGVDSVFGVSMLNRLAGRGNPILGPGVRISEALFCLSEWIVASSFLLVGSERVSAALHSLVVRFVRHDAKMPVGCRVDGWS